jgi:Spy/CpxP family protein refolding chaperone
MVPMKKAIVVTTLILMIGFRFSTIAQNQTRVEHRLEQLKIFLSLTDEQSGKVKDILTKAEDQTVKERESKPMNKRKALKNSQVRMQDMDKEIEALLNPEQLKKYESYKLERKSEMKGRRKGTKFYRD